MGATMTTLSDELREHMRKLGRKGGQATATKLSPEAQRKRSAKGGRAGKGSKKPRKLAL